MNELGFDLTMLVASFAAGLLGALVGLGGGVLITPLLVLGFHIDIRYAMGAALASVIATSSGAGAAYLRDGVSNMRVGLFSASPRPWARLAAPCWPARPT